MKYLLLFIIQLGFISPLISQLDFKSGYASFCNGEKPYIEFYLSINKQNLGLNTDSISKANITIIINNEQDTILKDNFTINIDQKIISNRAIQTIKYQIPVGKYKMFISAKDLINTSSKSKNLTGVVNLECTTTKPSISDIVICAPVKTANEETPPSFIKAGKYIEPLPLNFIRKEQKGFSVYTECYFPEQFLGEKFMVDFTVSTAETNVNNRKDIFKKAIRLKDLSAIKPVIFTLNTKSLKSGSYLVTAILRNKQLEAIQTKRTIITISNPFADVIDLKKKSKSFEDSWVHKMSNDSLNYALKAILPIISSSESEYIIAIINGKDKKAKQLSLYNHFAKQSKDYPEIAYDSYINVAKIVDKTFNSGFGHGFETDRGHVFLKYGMPDDRVSINNDPSAPPYEIWIYNHLAYTNQANRKILFYNPSLDDVNYVLLHSTIRGEIADPQWKRKLYSKAPQDFIGNDSAQDTEVSDNVGRYADKYFEDY